MQGRTIYSQNYGPAAVRYLKTKIFLHSSVVVQCAHLLIPEKTRYIGTGQKMEN